MARYDSSTAEVLVFTFKEGLLSGMAHDLKLKVTKFSIDVTGGAIKAEFDASSLTVISPMKDGAENAGALPKMLYAEIEKNAREDVLHSKKHPQITFTSTSITEQTVTGTLTLCGQSKPVTGKRTGTAVEVTFDQRDFGVKPFTAMLGTLKVKPEVRVKVTLPADAASA
ncbi:MAG: YceI family protein [Myxococcaceae bacterium]